MFEMPNIEIRFVPTIKNLTATQNGQFTNFSTIKMQHDYSEIQLHPETSLHCNINIKTLLKILLISHLKIPILKIGNGNSIEDIASRKQKTNGPENFALQDHLSVKVFELQKSQSQKRYQCEQQKNLSTPTETIMEKLSKFEQKHNLIYSLSVPRAQKVSHSKLNKTTWYHC